MWGSKPTVFVVDDDIAVRRSLQLLMESAGWESETFASASEFLARPRLVAPSCLVLDVVLPNEGGCELQQRVADRTGLPIIFISGHGDVPIAVRAMKAGALDFLTKPVVSEILLTAIKKAIDRSQCQLQSEAELRVIRDCHASLSRREKEVMRLVASGMLNKQVGGELHISEITVKAHRGRLMHKMKASSFASLVRMASRLRLTTADRFASG
jgi:FixJ family two-component response regulator